MDKGFLHLQKHSKSPKYFQYERMAEGASSPFLTTVHCLLQFSPQNVVEFEKVFQEQQQISRSKDHVSEASRSKRGKMVEGGTKDFIFQK